MWLKVRFGLIFWLTGFPLLCEGGGLFFCPISLFCASHDSLLPLFSRQNQSVETLKLLHFLTAGSSAISRERAPNSPYFHDILTFHSSDSSPVFQLFHVVPEIYGRPAQCLVTSDRYQHVLRDILHRPSRLTSAAGLNAANELLYLYLLPLIVCTSEIYLFKRYSSPEGPLLYFIKLSGDDDPLEVSASRKAFLRNLADVFVQDHLHYPVVAPKRPGADVDNEMPVVFLRDSDALGLFVPHAVNTICDPAPNAA